MAERTSIRVGTSRVSSLVGGAGPTLVLVHGSCATAEGNWGSLVERFSKRWKVVAPDLPGSGLTEDDGGRLELDHLVSCVDAATTGAPTFDLVGYSLGAGIVAALAAQKPQQVNSLVLIAGWPESKGREQFQFDLWQRLIKADSELLVRYLMLTGFSPAFYTSASREQLEKATMRTALPAGSARQAELDARLNVRHILGSIKCPTLVVGLRYDRFIPVSHSLEFKSAIKGAEYLELDGGHLLPFEDPTRLGDAIEPFLLMHRPN